MKRFSGAIVFVLLLCISCNSRRSVKKPPADRKPAAPKLVVLVSVDQMRMDYFQRFGGFYSKGLKRLWENGAVFTDTHHEHAFTGTGPGHATISTGCYPSVHGIVENSFFVPSRGKMVYCVEDTKTRVLGVGNNGNLMGASPENLQRSTVGDWLKDSNSSSKVFSVAFKDRSSVLMAGRKADRAFWFDNVSTRFVSSDYYGNTFPGWVSEISGQQLMKKELESGWQRKMENSAYLNSREDNFEQESGTFTSDFPHTRERMRAGIRPEFKDYILLWTSPFGDAYTLKFAERLILNERLGKDDNPDLLLVGCSTADAVGHHFGPLSQEAQDYYLHLDEFLGQFLDFLDASLGTENYALVLTGDHGVLPMPEDLARRGYRSRRISMKEFDTAIREVGNRIKQELDLRDSLIRKADAGGLSLFYREALDKGISEADLRSKVAESLRQIDFVEDAYTSEELENGTGRSYSEYYQRSYFRGRGHDIKMRFEKYALPNYRPTGTSHGSPYEYDTHVPLVFYGKNFKSGYYNSHIATVDIAPTIARLLEIDPESGINGKVLEEAFVADPLQ